MRKQDIKKRNRKKGDRVSASYTLEAAFVVPIIFGILFALLYFLYYEHDQVLLRANIKQEIIDLAKNQEEIPKDKTWRKQLQENLWMAKVDGGSVRKTAMKIKGSGKAQMHLHIPVMEYFLAGQQEISWSYDCDFWQPEQMLRQRDTITKTGDQ